LGCHGACEKYAVAQAANAKVIAERKRRYEAEEYAMLKIGKNKIAQIKGKAKK
jgi:hypothetical protein